MVLKTKFIPNYTTWIKSARERERERAKQIQFSFKPTQCLDPSSAFSGVGGRGRQPLNSAPPAPHEYADKCVTSVPERLELYGKAAPNRRPSDAEPRKTPKILQEGGGEVLGRNPGRSSASPRAFPPPVLRVPKIGKKCRFDTFFGRFSTFRKSQNAVNYSIFAF